MIHDFSLSGHDVYYYSFGACEAFRRKDTHMQGTAVITFDKKDLDPQIQKSFAMWTTKRAFDYKLVHGWRDHQPWCIYVMVHSTTEPASKVKLDTFQGGIRQPFENVSNDTIVSVVDTVPLQCKEVVNKFEDAINLFSHVVPSDCLTQIRSDLKYQATHFDSAKQKLQGGDVEKREVIEAFDTLRAENLQLFEKVFDMEDKYKVDVTKETQRNDFCYQLLNDPLSKLNYVCKPSIENTDVCLFGKSLMDLYFYKDGGSTINAAVLKRYETDIETDIDVMQSAGDGVVAGLAEFKVEGTSKSQ